MSYILAGAHVWTRRRPRPPRTPGVAAAAAPTMIDAGGTSHA